MSTTAIFCSKCGAQNVNTSQFCGGCGAPVGPTPMAAEKTAQPMPGFDTKEKGDKDWHEMAGLICGVVSMFLCGIFVAAPGLYFSNSARGIAKAQGRGTGLATTGLVLNSIGVLVTFAWIALFILTMVLSASGQPDPMMPGMDGMNGGDPYGPYGY